MKSPETSHLIAKANQSIKAAETLFKKGFFSFTASRAYYAMFYIAEALLLSKSLSYSAHGAVISAFGKYFSKTDLVDKKFHRYLIEGFEIRQVGDYETREEISKEASLEMIKRAKKFLKVGKDYLKSQG